MYTVEDARAGHPHKSVAELTLGYPESWGTPRLRPAIADTECQVDDVRAFAGAEEAVFWVMQLLAGPGDHVLVTVPNYQASETIPRVTGADVTGIALDETDDWRFDLNTVRAALRPNTTVFAVNCPNNPTEAAPDHRT